MPKLLVKQIIEKLSELISELQREFIRADKDREDIKNLLERIAKKQQ